MINEINELKQRLKVTIAAHFYQQDEVFNIADLSGDSLELAKKASLDPNPYLIFCGVAFMGQSVKILSPQKRVFMPRLACCSMARMIDGFAYEDAISKIEQNGFKKEDIFPITYINSSAQVKGLVAKMGGLVCTSSNAKKIIELKLKLGKKIFFLPDRCLAQNVANAMGLKHGVVGLDDLSDKDIFCYNGFCSVHQLFTPDDIEFFRQKYPSILIAVHPECDPSVVKLADFVGSTSQIINFVASQPLSQKLAIGTEYNLVNRLRKENTFVLSSTKPECPTMNETSLKHVLETLKAIEKNDTTNEVFVEEETAKWAKLALQRMLDLS